MPAVEVERKPTRLEDDERIVAGTLKGKAEIEAGKGRFFDNIDDAIAFLKSL